MAAKDMHVHPEYSESGTLFDLDITAQATINNMNKRYEETSSDFEYDTFMIIIGGECFEFILGGPQYAALTRFIDSLASETA